MEKTGFSEITEERVHYEGPGFWYCEIAVTGRCNFSCHYCNPFYGDIDFTKICNFIDKEKGSLKHIQLTGGEPTEYGFLSELCRFINDREIRLGISTNGSADYNFYRSLNADRFSISLDDYDTAILIGRGYRHVNHVLENIRRLSEVGYVDVGVVVDKLNYDRIHKIITYILSLGVADIKLSVSTHDGVMPLIGKKEYSEYPILNYRVKRFRSGLNMRGIAPEENFKCELMRNDISILEDCHYPCLVYAREGGSPIGRIDGDVRGDRDKWYAQHDPKTDAICKEFCMDFKCEFNRARTAYLRRKG
jgi:MoaA/NifB/PqqE/SkfB family radical SAM enzyme